MLIVTKMITTLCDITFWLVSDLPLESRRCYVPFDEDLTSPLFNVTIMMRHGVMSHLDWFQTPVPPFCGANGMHQRSKIRGDRGL